MIVIFANSILMMNIIIYIHLSIYSNIYIIYSCIIRPRMLSVEATSNRTSKKIKIRTSQPRLWSVDCWHSKQTNKLIWKLHRGDNNHLMKSRITSEPRNDIRICAHTQIKKKNCLIRISKLSKSLYHKFTLKAAEWRKHSNWL